MLAAALCLPLLSQGPAPVLRGRVIAADGAPVPAAAVVVGCQAEVPFEDPFELLAEARTDAAGAFELALPAEWLTRVGYRELDTFAVAEGHGLVIQHWDLAGLPLGFELELRLSPDPHERVRIVHAAGAPVAGARVMPLATADPLRAELRMPAAWWEAHAALTDAEGWATLPSALGDIRRLRVLASDGVQHDFVVDWQKREPLPHELALPALADCRVAWEGDAPPDLPLRLGIYGQRETEAGTTYRTEHTWQGRLEGRSPRVLRLPEGAKNASLFSPDERALSWGTDQEALQAPGDVRLTRPELYSVRGRVVDSQTGAGVAGVRLRVSSWPSRGWTESAADGSFGFEVAGQGGGIEALFAAAGHRSVAFYEGARFTRPENGAEVDLGDLAIDPTGTVAGVVVGPDGEPAVGAWVVGHMEVQNSRLTTNVDLTAIADEAGAFVLQGAPLGSQMEVTARRAGAEASFAARAGERLELALVARLAARGRLVDQAGAPVAGAEVEVWSESPPRYIGGERLAALGGQAHVASGADGRFKTGPGLDPEVRYALVVAGEGVEDLRSDWLTVEQLGRGVELVLRRKRVARGVLRAPDGAPLAGVTVRLRRGGGSAVTDGEGRWELVGLPARGDVLIAEPPDQAPHTRWIEGAGEVDWRLAARGEGRMLEPAPPADRALELELAFELLEAAYQEAAEAGDEGQLLRAVQSLAWADPALVLERVEAGLFETAWRRDFSLAYVADALQEASPEEALAVSQRITRGMSAALSVLDAARRLEPAAEREQLALVRAQARAVDPPEHRLIVLTELADRLFDLGESAAAEGVLEEGRAVAASLPAVDWPGYARSRFAEVLSRVDPDAGRALIGELADVDDRPRHLGNAAHELAASDPALAEELLAEVAAAGGSWGPGRWAARIAYRMAPVDLARARSIAERYDRAGFADGMIALALAEAAPVEALASLEQAFARAERLARGRLDWNEDPAAAAAALLVVAERLDPRGLETWLSRALALRRPAPRGYFNGNSPPWRADATLAFYLARWDPALARALLEPAVAAARKLEGRELGYEWDPIWAAAVVVDPEWAAAIAREEGGRAAAKVGLVLAIPPAQRTRFVQEELVGLWVVGKEDL